MWVASHTLHDENRRDKDKDIGMQFLGVDFPYIT